ncbi:MAG: hypothetical protein RLZZ297_755 [Chloroflexota bacterium]
MTNQAGSANWTCPSCGGMASILDARCPNCKQARPSATTQPLPNTPPAATSTQPAAAGNPAWRAVKSGSGSLWQRLVAWMDATPQRTAAEQPVRGVAVALALIGGMVGAQHFYMGRRVLGVLSVVLCWTFWPAAIGMMDAARLLFMSDSEFRRACR